jgi:deoxyribodipyrimidine photo-lyase
MMPAPSLVWFRIDLRLADQPALSAAIRRGGPIVPVFIWAPDEELPWPPGGASRWWLHQSLKSLDESLRVLGSRLVIRRGGSLAALRTLARETGARAVFWNRRYEPFSIKRDQEIIQALMADGLEVQSFTGALLHAPRTIANQSGKPFQVFTPFWKTCLALPDPPEPLSAPQTLMSPKTFPKSLPLEELELEPKLNWADGLRSAWRPGEPGAHGHLQSFLDEAFEQYADDRNRPDRRGTSRLSPHLHFGEISPRQIWNAVRTRAASAGLAKAVWRNSPFLAELGWREFAHHLLVHFPHTTDQPLRARFAKFPWRRPDPARRQAWQLGRTGYPLVDAGMRELWTTGWMHNRVRMVAASFLVKHLLMDWREGARWFWDTLVDADLAQNTLGWQWTAGCGADAAPYFRVFNPTSQGEKFDPAGAYIRRWVPELAGLPDQWIHQPQNAPAKILSAAGIAPGKTYPHPIVDHTTARDAALAACKKLQPKKTA